MKTLTLVVLRLSLGSALLSAQKTLTDEDAAKLISRVQQTFARQIRKSAPQSRIIFVSQESSPDIVQEALSLGTCGYVVKGKAEHDLLAIVDAVLEGSQFLSGTLAGASY